MCFLCSISRWSRRIASILPWLVIPFMIMWALSQLLPPSYRLEVTSSRLACLVVLLMSLVWYELLMPLVSQWRAHRSALLRERKLIEALEAAKWRKEATRRCRNCLTAYRIQMPGSGKYVCTYCGHISKRPVLEVAGALSNPKLMAKGSVLSGNGGASMLHLKGACDGNGALAAWSRAAERNGCAWSGEGSRVAGNCHLGQFLPAPFLFISRFLLLVWRHLSGIGQTITDGAGESNRVLESKDDISRVRSEKARRKADKKKQARLQKEILEAEDRKQREEVALLVEERRRQRDELEVTKQKDREADAERDKESQRKWDKEKPTDKIGKKLVPRVADEPTELKQENRGGLHKHAGEAVRPASPMRMAREQVGDCCTTTNTSSHTNATSHTNTVKGSRGAIQDHTSRYRNTYFSRLGLLKGTEKRPQKALGSAPSMGVISQGDGLCRGQKEAAPVSGKVPISVGGPNLSSKTAGTSHMPDSAWKRAPWISAWVKGSKGVLGDNRNEQYEMSTEGGKGSDQNLSSSLKSSNNNTFVSKSPSLAARCTAIQPPIAPPTVHVDPVQQLFSTPSLFSPMNLQTNISNQFEEKLPTKINPIFLPEHTFFEAQSYSQSFDSCAPPCTSTPMQMPIPVSNTISVSMQPSLGGTESSFVQSKDVSLSSVYLETVNDRVPPVASEPLSKCLSFAASDISAEDTPNFTSFLAPLKVSELQSHSSTEKLLPWDCTDEVALQSAVPLATVPCFSSESVIPGLCLLSPQKTGSPKVNGDIMVNGLWDSGKDRFSMGFDTAGWDVADGSQKEPAEFVDCITQEIMKDPVITADGHSYERSAIEQWLKHHDTSPKTGEVLPPPPGGMGVDKTLRPNHILRGQIIQYKERLTKINLSLWKLLQTVGEQDISSGLCEHPLCYPSSQ